MKLYLASFGLQSHLSHEFFNLVGKPAQDIKFAFIANAAYPYPASKRIWVDDVKKQFTDLGLKPRVVDLRNYSGPKVLKPDLAKYDVIWCGGGNTWYLRYVMRTSGFDQVIKELGKNGVVYAGDSAGAVVMTPTLKYVDLMDDPKEAPERIEEGLGLVDFCIVPHWDNQKYAAILSKVRDNLVKDGYKVKTLTDQQAVIVDGKTAKVVGA